VPGIDRQAAKKSSSGTGARGRFCIHAEYVV
jgi:hypothetical protein